jgi:hypothetical protein
VISTNYQALVSGNYGPPFVWPLVGNLYDTSGGAQIKVPMPYTKSMIVTVQGNPDYFHVIYRQFNDSSGVTTFNPFDGYHANTVTIDFEVNFGNVALAAGSHQLTWTVTGKNPASANYLVGIDYLVFTLQ